MRRAGPSRIKWLAAASILLAACAQTASPTALPTQPIAAPSATTAAIASATTPGDAATAAPTVTSRRTATATALPATNAPELLAQPILQEYPVPPGTHPHDVAPALDGGVWYTAQFVGALGYLDPETGATEHIPLGPGLSPHGVIVGPDGAPWITDSGLNAIVRVDPATRAMQTFPLPLTAPNANLNTAAFDGAGVLWFTGQNGYYGRLDPATGAIEVWGSPRGRGPYGIATTPDGQVFYASLAGSHIAALNLETGEATVLEPPTAGQGARRVWSDSQGRVWVSEWNAGQLGVYTPATGTWQEWRLPGANPQAYAVYVDENDHVWVSDFGANSMVRFDPATEIFLSVPLPSSPAPRPTSARYSAGRVRFGARPPAWTS